MYPAFQRKENMQIQLKQVEIVSALHAFISAKGINLTGKTVDISFTAGRKDAGLSADISIEDAAIPGLEEGDDTAVTKPVLAMVKPMVAVAAIATPETEKARQEPMPTAASVDAVTPVAAEKASTTSLFG